MALFEIKNRWTGSVLFAAELSAEYDSKSDGAKMGAALRLAISADANLAYADLAYADLTGADLTGANLASADLAYADLTGADLTDADLTGADLACTSLACANLAGANLTGANLACANLACANLTDADLTGAELTDADLTGADLGDGVTATKIPLQLYGLQWPVIIFDAHIRIGCQLHTTDEWEAFDDSEIGNMASGALAFWRAHKEAIIGLARLHQAGIEESQKEAA